MLWILSTPAHRTFRGDFIGSRRGVERWTLRTAGGPHPQRLRWGENALDLHTVWLSPAAAGPEAPRSARAKRMLKRSIEGASPSRRTRTRAGATNLNS